MYQFIFWFDFDKGKIFFGIAHTIFTFICCVKVVRVIAASGISPQLKILRI